MTCVEVGKLGWFCGKIMKRREENKMKFVFVFAMVLSCGVSLPAFAHSGLTNANGCHTDNDGSNYHCHEDRRRAGVEIASSPLFEPEVADIGASTTRPA